MQYLPGSCCVHIIAVYVLFLFSVIFFSWFFLNVYFSGCLNFDLKVRTPSRQT